MTVIHQNVEIKSIPGVDRTLPEVVAEDEAEKETAETLPVIDAPASLSPETTRLLRHLNQLFRDAPPLSGRAGDALSAL